MHRNTAMIALVCAFVWVSQAAAGREGDGAGALIGNGPPIASRHKRSNVSQTSEGLEVTAREGNRPRELFVSWRPFAHLPHQHMYTLAFRRFMHQNYAYVQAAGPSALLKKLVPGAVYELAVAPHRNEIADALVLRVPLRPLPALELKVSGAEGGRVSLSWRGPALADSALGGYRLRYSTPHVPAWLVLDDMPANQTEAEIEDLTPGVHYIFELDTLSDSIKGIAEVNTSGSPLSVEHTVRPLINSMLVLLPDPDERSTTLAAIYSSTENTSTLFDSYRFTISRVGGGPGAERRNVTVDAGDSENLVRFEDLTPGYVYNVTMVTVSNNVSSDLVSRQERLAPGDVPEVRAKRLHKGKASVEWDAPDGYYTNFEVSLAGEEGALPPIRTPALKYIARGLTPRTNYTVTVTVYAGDDPTDETDSEGRTVLLQM